MPPLLTQHGETPLQKAEEKGYTAIVKALEDVKAAGELINWKLLHAANKGDLALLNAAIEAGADVEAKDSVRGINRQRAPLPPSFHSMDHVHTPPPPSRHFSL